MKQNRFYTMGLLIMLIICFALGADYPYTEAIEYPNGYMPETLTEDDFQDWWEKYKSSGFLANCNGGIRTTCKGEDGEGTTKVESMGWAMIMAAYMADKETFDGLYKFYKSKLKGHGMMDWKVSCGGGGDGGSASDGDLDVAYAMVVAAWQWGESYESEAKKIISTVKKLITQCNGTSVIVGGYGGGGGPYGGCNQTDLSYYTPAFFREMSKISGDNVWEKLADDTYKILEANANSSTGLVPDWHKYNGGSAGGQWNHTYRYDACRVPWRIALDYLWNGNEKAKAWCTKISNWAYKQGPENIKDEYQLNGSATGRYHNMSFVGGFGVGSMCNSQDVVDAFGKEMVKMGYDKGFWYHGILGPIYAMTMTGHMWNPDLVAATRAKIKKRQTSVHVMTVTNRANRELCITGIQHAAGVHLTTLNGRLVKQTNRITDASATLDMSSVNRGCYILTVQGSNGAVQKGQVISVY